MAPRADRGLPLRFLLVGGINTLIDFGLLFLLSAIGVPVILANTISTGTALIFSFFANRNFAFKATGSQRRQFVLFLIVTLFGLWVLQPIVLWLVTHLLASLAPELALLIAKLCATAVTMTWNFFTYKKVIFR